ncbi:MAG: hypothetical protein BWY80_01430 [Firmicutes bacterium ADurb.Bin456]|nr:MAG: hypothetical protein BWY80_01430 [Firmicutes bacterium ADurb.Bin456]
MFLCIKIKTSSYKEFFDFLLGRRLGKLMDGLSLFMLLGGLSVMMAGSAAVFGEQFGLPVKAGVWVVILLTSLVILGGLEGVMTANVFLVPLKLLAVFLISLAVLGASGISGIPRVSGGASGGVAGNWAAAGFLYVSYNMIVPVAVLSSLGRSVTLKLGIAGGILGGGLIGLAVFLVTLAGLAHMPEAASYQIPLLYLTGLLGPALRWSLGVLIWLAILTTAIADAHGFASRLAPGGGSLYRLYGIGVCLLALPLSGLSFSVLVRVLYPLFGCAGLILLVSLLLLPFTTLFQNFKNNFTT